MPKIKFFYNKEQARKGFSLLELLLVIAISSVLAALLFPAFNTVRGRARQAVCQSNLQQIGAAVAMYTQDYDGFYPYAIDGADQQEADLWSAYPDFQARIPQMDFVQNVLHPYTHSPQLFRCPSDTGFTVDDFTDIPLDATPTSYEKFGSSYYYRTEIAQKQASESSIEFPSQINLLLDGAGDWHGSLLPSVRRYNILFADGHVKSLSYEDMEAAWAIPLNSPTEDAEN